MYDLSRFSLGDMIRCGTELRKLGQDAGSMEEVAARSVRYLYESLRAPDLTAPGCVLARIFVTLPFVELDRQQQAFARRLLGDAAANPAMKCLTLLATAGQDAAWNSRHTSRGHVALPLPSDESLARSPMIAQLMRQLGVETGTFFASDPQVLIDLEQHTFNVFHVSDALGSPYIPAQEEFVIPYAVRSVIGFGGLLPNGELFATVIFSRVAIARDAADLFKTLALNLKVALLPFASGSVFA
jgi:hypothetical protein